MKKIFNLGWTLVIEGIITREQLEKALAIQAKHPTRSISEIVHKLYDIPEGKIEAVFIQGVLIPSVVYSLYSELQKKILKEKSEIRKIIPDIEVAISHYQRQTTSYKGFQLAEDRSFQPVSEKKFVSAIDCKIDAIILKTSLGTDIEFKEVSIEFDLQSQKVSWENPGILMEMKIRLNQAIKKAAPTQVTSP